MNEQTSVRACVYFAIIYIIYVLVIEIIQSVCINNSGEATASRTGIHTEIVVSQRYLTNLRLENESRPNNTTDW